MCVAWVIIAFIGIFVVGWIVYALPATLSLKRGTRPGIKRVSIDDAIEELRITRAAGFELIEKCRQLIITRMQYCRRNSFDSYRVAFERGYGYCQQQAFALKYVLTKLGFAAHVVYAARARFPDGDTRGHAWVRVSYNGVTTDLDTINTNLTPPALSFLALTKVRPYTSTFRLLAGWASIAVNAYRYYRSGKDSNQ
jgi:hypothetical protein